MANNQTDTYGSEGDAYRYTKKVLKTLPNASRLESIYTEVAQNRGISSWTRAAYMDLRTTFFRDGQCKIRFAPGAARIAFGELELGTGDEQLYDISQFHEMLRIISIAHCMDYTRHLATKDGALATFNSLNAIYGTQVTEDWDKMKRRLRKMKYGPRRYRIIELDSYETAKPFYEYTRPHDWCHLGSEEMFNRYHKTQALSKVNGKCTGVTNFVRLYLAVLPGFETMTEDNELYGESMLGIDIGPGGRLIHVNNRWNHHHDNIDERKGDNKYSELELSMLLGGPFFDICPPYTVKDEREQLRLLAKRINAANRKLMAEARRAEAAFNCGVDSARRGRPVVDERTGRKYGTVRIGKTSWLDRPMDIVPEGFRSVTIPPDIRSVCQKDTPKIRTSVLTVTDQGLLMWKTYDDPGFAPYKEDAIRRISTIKKGEKSDDIYRFERSMPEKNELVHAMRLPGDTCRIIVRDIVADRYDALTVGLDVFIPLLLVNDKLFALHPSYNETVSRCKNGVPVPDSEKSGYRVLDREATHEYELCSSEELHYNPNTADLNAWKNRDPDAKEYKVVEVYENPALWNLLKGELEQFLPMQYVERAVTVADIVLSMFSRTTIQYLNLQETAIQDICAAHGSTPTEIRAECLTQEIAERRGVYAAHGTVTTAGNIEGGTVQLPVTRRTGIYYGSGNSYDVGKETGCIYANIQGINTFYINVDDLQASKYSWCASACGIPFSIPMADGPVSGYTYSPFVLMSDKAPNEYEKTLADIGTDRNIIVRIEGTGDILYPKDAKDAVRSDEFDFPSMGDIYAMLAAYGFQLHTGNENFDKLLERRPWRIGEAFPIVPMPGTEAPEASQPAKPKRVGGGIKLPKKKDFHEIFPKCGIEAYVGPDSTKEDIAMAQVTEAYDRPETHHSHRYTPMSNRGATAWKISDILKMEARGLTHTLPELLDGPLLAAGHLSRWAKRLGLRYRAQFGDGITGSFDINTTKYAKDTFAVTVEPNGFSLSLIVNGNSKSSYFTPYMVKRKSSRKLNMAAL